MITEDHLEQLALTCSVSTHQEFGACSVARPPGCGYLLGDADVQIATDGDASGL